MARKECIQHGHLIYGVKDKCQPDLTGKCWSGENNIAFLLTRRKRWSVWGLFVIFIWAQIQLGRLIYYKFQKRWPDIIEPDKLP